MASLDSIFETPSAKITTKPAASKSAPGTSAPKASLDDIFATSAPKPTTSVSKEPAVESPVITPHVPAKADNLFTRTKTALKNALDSISFHPKKEEPTLNFEIGEGTPDKAATEQAFNDSMSQKQVPGQEIKFPFVDKGVQVPSDGGAGAGYSFLKSFIEFPERAVRSLGELTGRKTDSENRKTQYTVPSYAEVADKTTGELIDQGVPAVAAVILGSAKGGGDFANDALMYEGLLSDGVAAVTRKATVPAESQLVAYDFLGRPKTIEEAELAYRKMQKEFHPDKTGGDQTVSAKANEAIVILRQEGIPTQSKFKQAVDALLNKPVSDLFKSGEIPTKTKPSTIKGFLEDADTLMSHKATLKEEINDAVRSHGTEMTQQALQDTLGLDATTANKLVLEAQSERAVANVKNIADQTLEQVVPTKKPSTSIDNIFGDGAKNPEQKKTETPAPLEKENPETKNIPIGDLTSYEGAPDAERVDYYKKKIEAGEPVEPLVAMKDSDGKLGIEDGKHRYEAYRQLGHTEVPVTIKETKAPEMKPLESKVFKRMQAEHPELTGDASYDKMSLKKDAEKAVDLISKDKEQAFSIAMGAEQSADVTSTAVNIALAERALEEGNHALYSTLIKNRSLAQVRRGQEIVAEKGSVTDNSTARYVKELISTRLDKLGNGSLSKLSLSTTDGISIRKQSTKQRATNLIKKEVEKAKKRINRTKEMDLDEAQALLDSLICK